MNKKPKQINNIKGVRGAPFDSVAFTLSTEPD